MMLRQEAHADCAPAVWVPRVLRSENLPIGAAVLVELVTSYASPTPPLRRTPPGQASPYALVQGTTRIALRIETVVPGLFRLVPERAPTAGSWTIDGMPTTQTVTFVPAAPTPPLSAPAVATVRMQRRPAGFRRGEEIEATARLRVAPPTEALLLVARWGNAPGAASFGAVVPGSLDVTVFATEGRCAEPMPERIAPTRGGPVRLLWIDRQGRVSEEITVTAELVR